MARHRRLEEPFPWEKLSQLRLHRIIGRCGLCRRFASWFRHRLAPTAAVHLQPTPTMFAGMSAEAAVRELRARGVHQGFQLQRSAIREIVDYASRSPCVLPVGDGAPFRFAEVHDGRAPDGSPVAVADVDMADRPCPAVERLSLDALLLDTVAGYLGYPPTRVATRLFWSPASRLGDGLRRRNAQPVDFHYDIDPARSLYFFFYLTPTDRNSGAHVVLPTTHVRKPISIVLGSTFQSAKRLRALYPAVEPLVIEGEPGFGFAEDPACFHKVLAPRRADRLALQLRYS